MVLTARRGGGEVVGEAALRRRRWNIGAVEKRRRRRRGIGEVEDEEWRRRRPEIG